MLFRSHVEVLEFLLEAQARAYLATGKSSEAVGTWRRLVGEERARERNYDGYC